jgi:hypothetical protein
LEVQLGKLSNFDGGKRQINFDLDIEDNDDEELECKDDFNGSFDDDNDDIDQKNGNRQTNKKSIFI